ncbi:MAG TPA: Do family serine endopeptidase [Cellvibrio sp.]|nr:Do family serine endopeptidase [Cellvibrio sp.]
MKQLLVRYTTFLMVAASVWIAQVSAQTLPDFSNLIEKSSPAVVKITAVTKARQARQMTTPKTYNQPQNLPDILRELLEQREMPRRDHGSLGSGFIVSADGYVLTNNHVISDADEIKIIMNDQREFDATLVGTDQRSDIALLKINAKNLPMLTLAKNEKLKVGQWVIAIGSPFGLDYSATAGIVSAIGRNIPSERNENTYVPFIQTDLAINPGNSGGPLFNMDGEVVGINSQIYTPSGGSVGLSFAIPASIAADVVAQLKEKGHVDRGWLGVTIQDIDRDLASSYGLDKAQGALVADVDPKGPALKAGLKSGDLITQFNGETIHTSADLPHIVGRLAPNTKVSLEVIRKNNRETLSVVIGKLPVGERQSLRSPQSEESSSKTDIVGLTVAPIDPEGGIKEVGVQILSVEPDSAASRAGLTPGDIITQLDFVEVDSVASYNKVVASLPKNVPKAIRFLRQGNPMFRSVTIK